MNHIKRSEAVEVNSKTFILPTANRTLSRCISQSLTGTIAYGSRAHIYFIDSKTVPLSLVDSKFLHLAHKGTVRALSFCNYDGPEILASWGEDNLLKIWDLETLSCSYSNEVKDLRCLEWVYGNADLLAYVTEAKHLIKYSLKLDKRERVRLKSEIPIHLLLSNELNPELMAAGLSDGTIMIINIVHERIEIKLKAHSADITDLAWSPHSDISLLSCSQDLSLRVWKINEDAPVFTYYSSVKKIKYEDKKFARTFGFFHPDEENTIIYLNARNEVGEISTDDPQNPKFHSYYINNIDMFSKFPSALILSSCKEYVYYFDTYKISKYSLKRKESITQFPFMYGIGYDLSISKLSANMLAIASGDGLLRIVNTGSDPEKLNLTSIYIQSKVRIMTVAWHPSLDHIMAYGTDQGRVGIADTYKKKSMYSFETHHVGTVYSLVWGTCSKAVQKDGAVDDLFLYSCGSGRIYLNKRGFPKDKALNFDDLIEKPIEYQDSNNTYSEMCWNSDYTVLCIGSLKGFIEIYDGSLKFLGRLIIPMKNLESVYWHPETTYMSPAGSSFKSWIACVGNDNDIYIFDTAPISSAIEPDVHMYRPVKQLIGHNRRVVKISWSYHEDGFLVSAAKDGCAMVWNVLTQTCIATYLHHMDIVYAVQWSLTDKDIIYSGGGDFSVRQWKVSEQTVQPAPKNAPKLRKLKKIKKGFHVEVRNEPVDSSNNISVVAKPLIDSNNGSSDIIDTTKTNNFRRPLKKKGVPIRKTLVYTPTLNALNTITEGDLENCMKLANFLSGKQKKNFDSYLSSLESLKHNLLSDEDILKIGVFADQLTVLRMIDLQSSVYLSKNDNDSAFELSLLGGNVQQVLKEAAENKTLSPFLVSMAPSVSCNFWLEICEKYAAQLIDQQQFYRAATYYLTCGKVHEAVNLIAERGNLLDAIAVAKARLPENDPFLPKLFNALRKKYDQALYPAGVIQCFLALNNPSSAAKVLASLKTPTAVRAAVHICRQFDLDKEANEYLFQVLETSLSHCDWRAFKKASTEEPFLQEYDALVSVHKALNIQIQYLKPRDGLLFQGIFSREKFAPKIKFYSGVTDKESNLPFIDLLKNQLLSKHVSAHEDIFKILNTLKLLEERRKSLEISSEAHVLVAVLLTQYLLLLQSKDANSGQILLNIFDATYNVVFLPRIISLLLFPFDLYWDEESKTFTYEMLSNWENEDNLLEYRNFCKDIAETFVNFKAKSFEVPPIAKDLGENLSVKVSNTKNILHSKSTKDFLLLYFIASNVNDLLRVVKKKEFQLKCSIHDQNISHENTIKVSVTVNDELLISNELLNKISSEYTDNINKILTNKEIVENSSKNGSGIKEVDLSSHEAEHVFNDLDCQKIVDNDSCEKMPCNKEVDCDSKNVPYDDDETCIATSQMEYISNLTNKADDISIDSKSVTKNNSSNNTDKKSFEDNEICELINTATTQSLDENYQVRDEENLIKNDNNMLILQNLIQSVIEEADNRAKSILEAKEKAENIVMNGINLIKPNQILSDINEVPNQTMNESKKSLYLKDPKVSHDSSENNLLNCDMSSHSTTQNSEYSLFNAKIDETLHESCLKRIDLLYNILLFFACHICRDEYAFLYHLKEKLKQLNNEMAANVLNEVSSNNFSQDKKIINKSKNLQQTSQIEDTNCNQNDLDHHKNDSMQIIENVSTEKTAEEKLSIEHDKLSEKKTEVEFQKSDTELSESCESLVEGEVTCDLSSKKCNSELFENKISNEDKLHDKKLNETGSIDSCKNETVLPEINLKNENGNQTVISENHEQSTETCETSESETINKNGNFDQTYRNKYSNASSNESEGKINDFSLTSSVYQNLAKKHEMLMDAISRLQEGSANCTYPNPFEITSKLCEATSDLIMVSNCYAVKNKLHSFLHSVINWTEKFGSGEINYVCQFCTSTH